MCLSQTVCINSQCLYLNQSISDAPQIAAALVNAFPSAIKITNDEGLLPLHLAAMSGFSAGIRTIFAYGFNTIYARENTEEMLPIDFAVYGYKTSFEEAHQNCYEEEKNVTHTEKEMEYRRCIDIFLMSVRAYVCVIYCFSAYMIWSVLFDSTSLLLMPVQFCIAR